MILGFCKKYLSLFSLHEKSNLQVLAVYKLVSTDILIPNSSMPSADTVMTKHACFVVSFFGYPDSKVHGAKMGPIWGWQDPGGPHVGPMNFAIWVSMMIAYKFSAPDESILLYKD